MLRNHSQSWSNPTASRDARDCSWSRPKCRTEPCFPAPVRHYVAAEKNVQRFQCFMRFSCSEIVQRKNENTWLLVWPHPLEREHLRKRESASINIIARVLSFLCLQHFQPHAVVVLTTIVRVMDRKRSIDIACCRADRPHKPVCRETSGPQEQRHIHCL